ncbi:MAG: HTH domain-containing protein, partial [Clostridia bacterium]|nr:HTH domain-containing protein [Clostridia bacterium]
MIKEYGIGMKFEIVLKILFDLLSNRTMTAKSIAEEYGISVRTVYRYIDCLDAAGVPLYTVRGNRGGRFAVVAHAPQEEVAVVCDFSGDAGTGDGSLAVGVV